MPSSQTGDVHYGAYVDYGRGVLSRHQWLWTTNAAGFWTNFVGILVPIAFARLVRILWRMDLLAADYAAINHPPPQGDAPKHILFTLEDDAKEPTLEGLGWQMFLTISARLVRGANRLPGAGRLNNVRGRDVAFFLTGGIVLMSTYVGVLVFGVLTSWLATDSTAPSDSPGCGHCQPTFPGADHYFNPTYRYELDAQLASATLAQDCYHADTGADGCNYFLQQSLDYDITDNATCPFAEHMCYGGKSAAISFSTAPISARALGINFPKTYEFHRNTTCSPLNMNETYIQLHKIDDDYTFRYYYGSPGDDQPFWLYTRGYATVLACLDQTRWRDPTQGPSWNAIGKLGQSAPVDLDDPKIRGGFWLFWFSILSSSTYQAISLRLGNALNATDRLSGGFSLPLATEQWKVEATRLFETSLARTQIEARNMARGVMATYPGYVKAKWSPPEMCQDTYLFVSQGWTNVNKAVSLMIVVPCALIIILAIPISSEKIVLDFVLCGFAMPVAAAVIYVIIKSGEGFGMVFIKSGQGFGTLFSRQTWIAVGGFLMRQVSNLAAGFKSLWSWSKRIGSGIRNQISR